MTAVSLLQILICISKQVSDIIFSFMDNVHCKCYGFNVCRHTVEPYDKIFMCNLGMCNDTGTKLLHSPSLVAIRLTVSGLWWKHKLAGITLLWLVGLNVDWDCLVSHCIIGSRDQWEFPLFFRRHWQSLCTAQTAGMPAVRAVQWDCEIVHAGTSISVNGSAAVIWMFSCHWLKMSSEFRRVSQQLCEMWPLSMSSSKTVVSAFHLQAGTTC